MPPPPGPTTGPAPGSGGCGDPGVPGTGAGLGCGMVSGIITKPPSRSTSSSAISLPKRTFFAATWISTVGSLGPARLPPHSQRISALTPRAMDLRTTVEVGKPCEIGKAERLPVGKPFALAASENTALRAAHTGMSADAFRRIAKAGTEKPVEVRNIGKASFQCDVGNSALALPLRSKEHERMFQP